MAFQQAVSAFVALILINPLFIVGQEFGDSCTSSTYKRFASKTAYRNADTPVTSTPKTEPGCTPLQIYGIFRHGTRYPSVTDVEAMIKKVPHLRDLIVNTNAAGQGSLCQQDVTLLKTWKLNFNGSMTNLLHDEGRREANAIAKRLRNRYPEILSKSYSPRVYQFLTTDTQRTIDMANSFVRGLFETVNGVQISTKENDDLLRFYKSCKRWESEVDDNETAVDEYFKFTNGPELLAVGDRVSKRIGLKEPLSFYNISILWEMCRFETAWNSYSSRSSPWCNLFSDEDLGALEYSEDLLYYWKEGYGYPINYQQSCPVLVDLFKNFKAFKDPSKAAAAPSGLFHFTHSGLLLKLYSRLGLFNDTKPLYADGMTYNTDRKWRTSVIDPFGGNIVFVLFKCTEGGARDESQLKVLTYVQEHEILLPNCTLPLCPLDTILANYGSYADNCDLDQLCRPSNSVINSVNLYLLTFTIILFAYHAIM